MQTEYVKKAQVQLTKINNGQDFMGLFKDYDDCQVNFQIINYLFYLNLHAKLIKKIKMLICLCWFDLKSIFY